MLTASERRKALCLCSDWEGVSKVIGQLQGLAVNDTPVYSFYLLLDSWVSRSHFWQNVTCAVEGKPGRVLMTKQLPGLADNESSQRPDNFYFFVNCKWDRQRCLTPLFFWKTIGVAPSHPWFSFLCFQSPRTNHGLIIPIGSPTNQQAINFILTHPVMSSFFYPGSLSIPAWGLFFFSSTNSVYVACPLVT